MNVRIATRLFLVIAGAAGILMAAPPATAQGAGGGPGKGPMMIAHQPPMERAFRFRGAGMRFWDNPRVAAALKLTPDQQKAMDQILFQHREKLIDLQANLQKAELDMEPLMNADQPNRAAIEAQINKVVAARGALEKANANFLLAIRMKLTPEQWKQIRDFRAERGMHMRNRDRWGHGSPGLRMHQPGGPGGPIPPPQPQSAPPGGSSNPQQ